MPLFSHRQNVGFSCLSSNKDVLRYERKFCPKGHHLASQLIRKPMFDSFFLHISSMGLDFHQCRTCNTSHMSCIVRKLDYCLCKNKGAETAQLISTFDFATQSDSRIPLLPKSKISSSLTFSETVQAGLCRTWSETLKTGFLAPWLI